MNKNDLYELRFYASSLGKGIDPTSGIEIPDDTIMSIPRIREYNNKVVQLIDALIAAYEKDGKITKRHKIPFFITKDEKEFFIFSETPISISEFCYKINGEIAPGMSKLRPGEVTRGLMDLGYLEIKNLGEDKMYKVPTEKGCSIGIVTEDRKNMYGNEYSVNLYTKKAQQFILQNLEKILQTS